MEEEDKIIKRPSTYPIFSKTFALQPTTAVDFANDCRKHFEEFNECFKRRIGIELEYAKNLETLSRSLEKYIQPGTQKAISFICSAFKVENQQRAHQARQLAESLRTQIYDICSNTCKEQSNIVKRIQKDVKKYIKEFESLEDSLNRSKESYQKVSEDMQQLMITKNYTRHTSEIPQQKKAKIISKTIDSIKQKKEYQKLYTCSHRNYNDFVREYNKHITEDLNQLQTQIRDQITLESDCMRKLIVCEVSMFKNIQYDLINISKQMEALDTQKDVEVLVEATANSFDNLIVQIEEYKRIAAMCVKDKRKSAISDISSVISLQDEGVSKLLQPKDSQIDKGMTSVILKQVEEQVFSLNINNKKNKDFKQLIQKRWTELNSKLPKPTPQSPQQTKQQQTKPSSPPSSQPLPETKQQQQPEAKTQPQPEAKTQPQPEAKQQQKPLQSQPQPQKNEQTNIRQLFVQYFTASPISREFLQGKNEDQKPTIINEVFENFTIITRYISEVWNGQSVTQIEGKRKSKSDVDSATLSHIKRILSLSHLYRIVSYAFLQSFRTHHQVMIENPARTRELGKFIIALLTKSSKENDVFVLRGLLGLLFTYFWMQNNAKKLLYAENLIYKHSLWKKQDFWDSAIFQSTYEQMLSFGPNKGESFQQTILREKNLIFTQLASYCHYMIMLGISSKNVRQIVGRYCRLYEMTDDQNRDLSKMITNTVKQYKEIFTTKTQKETNE